MAAEIGFLILSVALLMYFLFAGRKELPLLLVSHALLQYGLSMVLWYFHLSGSLASILMVFIWISSILLIWARSLNYGQDLFSIRLFFSVSQWAILLVLFLFIAIKSPFYYVFPATSLGQNVPVQHMTFHPILKLSGNLLIFTTFFHVIVHWGQRWKWHKSLIDLSPIIIYTFLLVILRNMRIENSSLPFS
ncbi:MAG: hypothetical protein MRZ79_15820 [Bacteroidia bacterium]|nr:hypothetical protein [Bacteroidia bacterium]